MLQWGDGVEGEEETGLRTDQDGGYRSHEEMTCAGDKDIMNAFVHLGQVCAPSAV
jgi:hypothetical protein